MPFALDPGRLRQQVEVRTPGARTSDGGGGFTRRYRRVYNAMWDVEIRPLQGTERLRAMQTQANATHQITGRYRSDVTSATQLVHEGRTFKIVAPPIDPEERHEWLQVLAREET